MMVCAVSVQETLQGSPLCTAVEKASKDLWDTVEDGGKAALSQKMRSGDELVNINGTPLYGSRQEALILIKGSYRTLKMIIRRHPAVATLPCPMAMKSPLPQAPAAPAGNSSTSRVPSQHDPVEILLRQLNSEAGNVFRLTAHALNQRHH
ncbi:hypothetical protein JD844_003925 [Phrynosoma platyrhinos]|uniref:PDZ domain-containing protein n=1 Tax=Phrynosoma platyrhinos TaxID=52577 RepID=A0ABQ7TMR2_PHRPL|nr:hypothetical protein JD844_003925 [Phrynosoma platyrhinos]